jgi:hypothetical protein
MVGVDGASGGNELVGMQIGDKLDLAGNAPIQSSRCILIIFVS